MANKIALVTGGSRGLGRDMALQLAHTGFDVIITYQAQKDAADAVVADIQALGHRAAALPLDLADSQALAGFAQQLQATLQASFAGGRLSALVNNAGIGHHAAFAETTADKLDLLFAIHFKAPFLLTQQLLPLLTDGASIVNITTGLTRFSYPGYSAYASMKAALDALTRYQAQELGARHIRVNSLAPGAIATDFGGGVVRDNPAVNQMIASQTALGRVGQADDIGSVVAFLCSDAAKWVNGQRIEVAGGINL